MTDNTEVLFVRVPKALIKAIHGEAKRREKATPGVRISQADVVRSVLIAALTKPKTSEAA